MPRKRKRSKERPWEAEGHEEALAAMEWAAKICGQSVEELAEELEELERIGAWRLEPDGTWTLINSKKQLGY